MYVLEGELTLVTDEGEQVLTPGTAAAFPAGWADGHHLINRGTATAHYIEIGDRSASDVVTYSDIDMRTESGPSGRYVTKAGTPY